MSLTNEELMRPRWEVIADYPGSKFKIGDTLVEKKGRFNLDKYPAIFLPLRWWENRAAQDMPTYLKDEFGAVIKSCGMDLDYPWLFLPENDSRLDFYSGYVPATEEEYNAYRASLK